MSGVKQGQTITQERAEYFLQNDLAKYEGYVIQAVKFAVDQGQFDALVSFTYNCGQGNLKKLVANRNAAQVASALLLYNKGGGKVLAGLTRRRKAEQQLFLSGCTSSAPISKVEYYPKCGLNQMGIAAALKSIGVDSSFSFRSNIAVKNGITNYKGTADQNIKMLELLKKGKLIK